MTLINKEAAGVAILPIDQRVFVVMQGSKPQFYRLAYERTYYMGQSSFLLKFDCITKDIEIAMLKREKVETVHKSKSRNMQAKELS